MCWFSSLNGLLIASKKGGLMLRIKALHKSLRSHSILKGIDLSMEKNTILGLAGPSGCGKSTLLRCIQGLEKPDSGTISLAGSCAFMFQDFQLFPHMSILDNVCYAPRIHTPQTDPTAAALQLLDSLGLSAKAKAFPHQCSGGQKQRAALCRCLMIQPSLLLCDEPTSGLDIATIVDVVQLLKKIHALGVTMILASHDLDFLTQIADRIVLLKEGMLVIDCQPQTITDPIAYLKDYYA
jgi:polar amino acid transport system ATP-binding protein